MARKPKKKDDFSLFPMIPMALDEMPEARKKMEELKDRIVEDMAELFKGMDEFSKSTLGFSIIMALSRRKELDDEEKEKTEKK